MRHSSLSRACAQKKVVYDRAMRLSRQIPNHPHPERARAVHEWAVAMVRVISPGKKQPAISGSVLQFSHLQSVTSTSQALAITSTESEMTS